MSFSFTVGSQSTCLDFKFDNLNSVSNCNSKQYNSGFLEIEPKKTDRVFNGFRKRILEQDKENLSPVSNDKRYCLATEEAEELTGSQALQQAEAIVENFLMYHMPHQWFSIVCEKGDIRFDFPEDLLQDKRLIYILRNKEEERYLVGKTGNGLKERSQKYLSEIKKFTENRRQTGRQQFLRDFRANPTHFEIGVLYILEPDENLNEMETLFIDYKSLIYKLYNDRRGGGGGLSHAEEKPLTYAIPRLETGCLTPDKYYHYQRNQQGQIRLPLTPSFRRKMCELSTQDQEKNQGYYYIIKKLDTQQSYVGTTCDPEKRSKEHGYAAEYGDIESEKYNPDQLTGALHPAMGEDPENFAFGLLPVYASDKILPADVDQFTFISGIAKVEKFLMQAKQSLKEQGGLNCIQGGGPIADLEKQRATKSCARRLDFYSTRS